jgi:hypothetical protein
VPHFVLLLLLLLLAKPLPLIRSSSSAVWQRQAS